MSAAGRTIPFRPALREARRQKALSMLQRLLLGIFALLIILSLGVYGFTVHYSSAINTLSRQSRALDEQNQELQVELDRRRSFRNIEDSAIRRLNLHVAQATLDVDSAAAARLPVMPKPRPRFAEAPGY
ncbi:MAG: hypothetical protein AB7P76_08790 [Candidatus Melainabacteria bacterium]